MHTIYIDADACPVKDEVYRVARRYAMLVKVVANAATSDASGCAIELVVRPGFGLADDWIAEQAGPVPRAARDRSHFLSKLDELVTAALRAHPPGPEAQA